MIIIRLMMMSVFQFKQHYMGVKEGNVKAERRRLSCWDENSDENEDFFRVSHILLVTSKSDQFQISPAASPEIVPHTVWRTWLFTAFSDERWLIPTTRLIHFSLGRLGECTLWTWEWKGYFALDSPSSWVLAKASSLATPSLVLNAVTYIR